MSLSKNVMNMKFMQKSLNRTEPKEKVSKVKDTSEWSLPNTSNFRNLLKPTILVKSVGYGSIAQMESAEQEQSEEESTPTKIEKVSKEEEAQKFLKSIEKGKLKRKREGGDSNKRKKKKNGKERTDNDER